jgi:hypothetical protein
MRLYLTNWSRIRQDAERGQGAWSAMAGWSPVGHGLGRVPDAAPHLEDMRMARSGHIHPDEYLQRCTARWSERFDAGAYAPGVFGGGRVIDRQALCCVCAGPRSPLRAKDQEPPIMDCHLIGLAPWLARAGWDVWLYGSPLEAT